MRIFTVDDERPMLCALHDAVREAEPTAEITDFPSASKALAAIEAGDRPDVMFSDIRMPDMDGLHLAASVKKLSPDTRIVFTTAYSQYALEAWKRHVHGYLLKPVTAEDVREMLDNLPPPPTPALDRLFVRCFGDFEVFWQGTPLVFERRQTKELFAFLIDKRGASCTMEEAAAALWESECESSAAKTRLRGLIHDLKNTLAAVGAPELLIRRRGLIGIRADGVDCDYYRMLRGEPGAVNAYRGEYMRQYSWAELTNASLYFMETN